MQRRGPQLVIRGSGPSWAGMAGLGVWAPRRARSRLSPDIVRQLEAGVTVQPEGEGQGVHHFPSGLSAPLKASRGGERLDLTAATTVPPTAIVLKTTDGQVGALEGPLSPPQPMVCVALLLP